MYRYLASASQPDLNMVVEQHWHRGREVVQGEGDSGGGSNEFLKKREGYGREIEDSDCGR